MSADEFAQERVSKVAEITFEPMYISEIVRKLDEVDDISWGLDQVVQVVSLLQDNDNIVVEEVGYNGLDASGVGSMHFSSIPGGGIEESKNWNPYTIVYNTSIIPDDIREEFLDVIDMGVSVEDKARVAERLSQSGQETSRFAELIMQDSMERQFRYYDRVELSDYNDPGIDFFVQDENERDYGLNIEISTRSVNPVGTPYIDSKRVNMEEVDSDLVILAPRFSDTVKEKYEDPDDPMWHSDPEGEMVHLHNVPSKEPEVYRPFAFERPDESERINDGFPIVVQDSQRLRDIMESDGHVGDGYPVVEDDASQFIEDLERVFRNFQVITESRYRNDIRQSIEPLFANFMRPYKIEQFLIDMYWDKNLNQSEIGGLVDRSGSTIGTWMRRWGVMRRGTGAPELSDDTIEIWSRMYRGEEPFPEQFSGYRIQAEYNRHPLWSLEDWEEWYQDTTDEERQEIMSVQDSNRDEIDYTVMVGANQRLQPSYTFILSTLRDNGVEIREPDEAPRVPYSAYPSRKALEYMLNKNQDTIVDVSEEE